MFNVPLFFTDTILRDYKNSTAVTLIMGGKKLQKVHKIVIYYVHIQAHAPSCAARSHPHSRTTNMAI
jgi:hypothetical protein